MKTVVASLIRKDNQYLIAKRKETKELGGLWEFPGGKVEDGETKERKSYPISDSAVYDIVVVSGENIAQKLLDDQLAEAGQYAEDVMIHILTTNEHPNTYGYTPDALMEKIQIQHKAFAKISERVKS